MMRVVCAISCVPLLLVLLAGCSEQHADSDTSVTQFEERIGGAGALSNDVLGSGRVAELVEILDPEQLRTAFEDEPVEEKWAASARTSVIEVYATIPAAKNVEVNCRTTACEVTGTISNLKPADVEQVVDQIAGERVNGQLASFGLQTEDEPVYTVLESAPLSVSFSRVLIRAPEQ